MSDILPNCIIPERLMPILETMFQNDHPDDFQELVTRKEESESHGYIYLTTDCGQNYFVPVLCTDPLCARCERIKAHRKRDKWYPVLRNMRSPKLITLTVKNGPNLKERIEFLQTSFKALLQMRLGPENLNSLRIDALEFVESHYRKNDAEPEKLKAELIRWEKSIRKFQNQVTNRNLLTKKTPRFRDMVGKGFAVLEVTKPNGWHPHRHLTVDGAFIPWPILCAAWLKVTNGEAFIVDVREIGKDSKSMKEAVKYLTKITETNMWSEDEKNEFRQVLKGMKRVWPLGKAKPIKPEKKCPCCGESKCRAQVAGSGELLETGVMWGRKYKLFRLDDETDPKRRYIMLMKDERGLWESSPLLDTLSFCAPLGMAKGP